MIISREQCRAARAWLDWKQEELASAAGVSLSTVRDFEKGRRTPIANNARAITEALLAAGVRLTFLDDGRPHGVATTQDRA
jgi:DNA-binding XRE family transcriptional regulator